MAGGGGCYLPAGRCTAGVTIPPISGQATAEASLEIDPTADRVPLTASSDMPSKTKTLRIRY
jgi:hypothetical protein